MGTYITVDDNGQVLAAIAGESSTFYLYGNGALAELTDAWAYPLADGSRTARQLVDSSGNVVLASSYTPWGDTLSVSGSGSFTTGYFGGIMDNATGLLYLGTGQYYDPATGRFLNRNARPNQANPYVPWSGDPLGAMMAPLAVMTVVLGRKKKHGKWEVIAVVAVLCFTVGMSLSACTPANPPPSQEPNNQGSNNPSNEGSATEPGSQPAAADTATAGPTYTCTPSVTPTPRPQSTGTSTLTPTPTPNRWDELWNLIQFVDVIDKYKNYFKDAVVQVSNAFGRTIGKDPVTSFISIFRLSASHKLKFQVGACSVCNGVGGYTHSAWWIEFAVQNPFWDPSMSAQDKYNRTPEMAYELNVHNIVHELGYAFANLWEYKDEKGKRAYVQGSPYSASYPSSEFITNQGFKFPGPDYQYYLWRMHPDVNENDITRHHEAFADMFMSWVYDGAGFDDTTWGTKRRDYMNEHMPLWLLGNPPFPSNN